MKRPSALRLLLAAVNSHLLPVIEEIGFSRTPGYEKLQLEYAGDLYCTEFFRFLPPHDLASFHVGVSRKYGFVNLGMKMNVVAFAEPCSDSEDAFRLARAADENSGLRLLAPASHDSSVDFPDGSLIGLPRSWRMSGDGPPEVLQARAEALVRRAAQNLRSRMPVALARARRRPVATIFGRSEAITYEIHRYPLPLPLRWLDAIASRGLFNGDGPPPRG
jgi:hypothetical protein